VATKLPVDPDLARSPEVSGERTEEAVVIRAAQGSDVRREQHRAAVLLGTLEWDDSCDYKAERSRRA
jgi:hypothetical protein